MRRLLDRLDPFFAAAAIAIAGMTLISQNPHPIILLELPAIKMPSSSTQ
ncbi:hypothetical protein PN498_09000 [Oscillatoria sp. CS-180]|nr:hypothetical protein [Oscillatoria sp. CS-180]MDB9526121.1 hypothetical protein [Oscillatoria sp. CS-180]